MSLLKTTSDIFLRFCVSHPHSFKVFVHKTSPLLFFNIRAMSFMLQGTHEGHHKFTPEYVIIKPKLRSKLVLFSSGSGPELQIFGLARTQDYWRCLLWGFGLVFDNGNSIVSGVNLCCPCAALSGILEFFFVCKKIALDKPDWRQDSFLVGKNLD